MPELPEVETTRRGIKPWVHQQKIVRLIIRQGSLRWPVTEGLPELVRGQIVVGVMRRAKYLILKLEHGSMLVHLGMSGSLRVAKPDTPWRKHDHIELQLGNGATLRFHDPRRFGAWLWSSGEHDQLAHLGPEPLSSDFDGERLWQMGKGRKMAVKPFIMDNKIVVGVGNIYANEALFLAGISPKRSAVKISKPRYAKLVLCITQVLQQAIDVGGTTLRDFTDSNGEPGYFAQSLQVYGRKGKPCHVCQSTLKEIRQGQRSTVYCPKCQR